VLAGGALLGIGIGIGVALPIGSGGGTIGASGGDKDKRAVTLVQSFFGACPSITAKYPIHADQAEAVGDDGRSTLIRVAVPAYADTMFLDADLVTGRVVSPTDQARTWRQGTYDECKAEQTP
jgi:hypothetical protein